MIVIYETKDLLPESTTGEPTMYQCDACGKLKPREEIKTLEVYGCEGDFCHACRHGKECDCE